MPRKEWPGLAPCGHSPPFHQLQEKAPEGFLIFSPICQLLKKVVKRREGGQEGSLASEGPTVALVWMGLGECLLSLLVPLTPLPHLSCMFFLVLQNVG